VLRVASKPQCEERHVGGEASVLGLTEGFSCRWEFCPRDGWSPTVTGISFKSHSANAAFEVLGLLVSSLPCERGSVRWKEKEHGEGHPKREDGIIEAVSCVVVLEDYDHDRRPDVPAHSGSQFGGPPQTASRRMRGTAHSLA
jgi:hypothetical protein